MSFTLTSTNVSVSGDGILRAKCRAIDGSWRDSKLNLDEFIGNKEGAFDIGHGNSKGFSRSARDILYKDGILHATLRSSGGQLWPGSFSLDMYVSNMDGQLRFSPPIQSEFIVVSCAAIHLNGSTLRAICLGDDGRYHGSEIDLNAHYTNRGGEFVSDDNHFWYTAKNVSLEIIGTEIRLNAELANYDRQWVRSSIDLTPNILNRGGRLIFERHDHAFDRDGSVTKFFEKVPLAGFVVAGIHALAGNDEWAKRALAFCANSSTVAVGILIGCLVGGVGGGMIGAALATPLGIAAETLIKHTIDDPVLRAQFEDMTLGRVVYETLRNTLAVGAAGVLAGYLGTLTADFVAQLAGRLGAILGRAITAGITLTEVAVYNLLKRIADAMATGNEAKLLSEWDEVEKKVHTQ